MSGKEKQKTLKELVEKDLLVKSFTKARGGEGFRKGLVSRVKCHQNINDVHLETDQVCRYHKQPPSERFLQKPCWGVWCKEVRKG